MWMMLQQNEPDDYVLATGETHTVRDFAELAFVEAEYNQWWEGEGVNERKINVESVDPLIEVDSSCLSPDAIYTIISNSSKALEKIG